MALPWICFEGCPGAGKTSVIRAVAGASGSIEPVLQDRTAWAPALSIATRPRAPPEAKLLAQCAILKWYNGVLTAPPPPGGASAVRVVESGPASTRAYAEYHLATAADSADAPLHAVASSLFDGTHGPAPAPAAVIYLECPPAVAAGRVQGRAVHGDSAWSESALQTLDAVLRANAERVAAVAGVPFVLVDASGPLDLVAEACASAVDACLAT